MHVVADTDRLVADGIITPDAATIIRQRARATMMALVTNSLLLGGITAASLGTVFWLADVLAVALIGALLIAVGLPVLLRQTDTMRFFGNASALIGAGMLMGGGSLKLIEVAPDSAGVILTLAGAAIIGIGQIRPDWPNRLVANAVLLMAGAMHLGGLGFAIEYDALGGAAVTLFSAYATAALVFLGWRSDIRFVTALAIVPFAQMLAAGTAYWHAVYAFYSPEPTLSILQMAALMLAILFIVPRLDERSARHGRILALMAFIVANLCALVGSLWGDTVGEALWGPSYDAFGDYAAYSAARDAWQAHAFHISEGVYAVLWAAALAAMAIWSAATHRRALFNAALTFGTIHAYTQLFESFSGQPFACMIGGFGAIPLAWGVWKLNQRFERS